MPGKARPETVPIATPEDAAAALLEALIEPGADVPALNDQGQTPLDALESAGQGVDREPVRRLV